MDQNNQEAEINPKQIFELMKKNIFDNYFNYSYISINKDYLSSRKSLFNILHKITNKMGFKSQTFFLSAHYLDILYSKKRRINGNLNTLGLACLCLSAKYCENDPMVPHLQYFIRMYNHIMGHKNIISMSDLKRSEVLVLKILNYKLNYFTIYDFNSFLFGHGILKIEQLKDIELKNRRVYQSRRKEFVINPTNSIMIKNILEKIYKKSRNYLNTIIENTKLCFKYSPLYLSIYIMKKSVEEILYNEQKINNCSKDEQDEFYTKNSSCFKQIMIDFYKIDYEANEQYREILVDDEILEIFEGKEKTEVGPAPSADKKMIKEDEKKLIMNNIDINTNININNEINNKTSYINSYSNGFYSRLKIKTNFDGLNRRQNERNIISSRKENTNIINNINSNINNNINSNINNEYNYDNKEEDDLDSILNINELQKVKWNNKNNDNNKNRFSINSSKKEDILSNNNNNNLIQNKYLFSTNNRYMKNSETYNSIKNSNTIKKNYFNNNYDLTYSVNSYRGSKIGLNKNLEPKTEKNSPKRFDNYNNYTKLNRFMKSKVLNTGNERNDFSYCSNDNNNNNNYNYNTIKKFEKKPYFRKLIHQNTNENFGSTLSSINRNGVPSYYYSNNFNSEVNRNKVNKVNNNNNTEYNTLDRNKEENNNKGETTSKINTFYSRIRIKNRNNENSLANKTINNLDDLNRNNNNDLNEKKTIITTSSRYRRKFYNNSNTNNNNDISSEIQNANNLIIKDTTNKKEIESYTQSSSNTANSSIFSKITTNNIFRRKNKILNLNVNNSNTVNQNEINEDNKGMTTRNFFRNNTNINVNKINVNTTRVADNRKNNEANKSNESTKRISYLLAKKNSDLNNTLKEINKANPKNNEKEIKSNILNNEENKKVYQSIRHKYLNLNKNKNNSNLNNVSCEVNINKNKIIEDSKKEYNSTININNNINKDNNYNSNLNGTKARFVLRNKIISNDRIEDNNTHINSSNNNNSILSTRKVELENKNKNKNVPESSIYRIINKTKTLFSRNHKEEDCSNKKISNVKDNNNSTINNNFYKTSQNFYKPANRTEINSNIQKEEKDNLQSSKLNNASYLRSIINRNKINKDNPNSQSHKNNSTIAFNNNINIGNKNNNINNDYLKYKSIYKKNNIPELNINKSISNNNNNLSNNISTNRSIKSNISNNTNNTNNSTNNTNNSSTIGNTITNLFQRLNFYRKTSDKSDNNNLDNSNNKNEKFQFFFRK